MFISALRDGSGVARLSLTCAALVMASNLAMAEDAKVEASLSAFSISIDEGGQEILQPANSIDPGELIEYKMNYKNVSDEDLSGLVISGDVPEATTFISANDLEDHLAIFEVEVEGIGWSELPVIRYVPDEDGVMRSVEVPAEEYEAVRWRLAEAISPGKEVLVSYRIKVSS